MIILPNSIWRIIFEFDSTYKLHYDKVMNEFIMSTSFWTMKSYLECDKIFKIYSMSYLDAKKKCSYWNRRYNNIKLCRKNISKEDRIKIINNPVIYNYPEYVSDVLANQPYFRKKIYKKK